MSADHVNEPEVEVEDLDTASVAEAAETDADSVLVQLHAALGELDHTMFQVRRALDRALGRGSPEEPPAPLPLQEITSVREHLRRSRRRHEDPTARRSIMDIAIESPISDLDEGKEEPSQIGVAPTGPLRIDVD